MNENREPTLEDLGLDQPVVVTNKISIEQLQRASDAEREMPSQAAYLKPKRNIALDVIAGLVAFVLPGVGHLLKSRGIAAALWFFAALGSFVLAIIFPLFWLLLLIIVVANVISAVVATPQHDI